MVKGSSRNCCILIQEDVLNTADLHLPCEAFRKKKDHNDL